MRRIPIGKKVGESLDQDTGRDDVVLLTFQRKKDAPKKREAPLEEQ